MQPLHHPNPKRINLMATCLVDTLFPRVGEAVVSILNKAGYEVHIPAGQTCCGQPAYNAGIWEEARQMAMKTIEVFEAVQGPVVIPSGSCAAMIKHGYPTLFADDPDSCQDHSWAQRANELSKRTYEFSEFLVDICQKVDFGATFPGPVTYHASCHLLRGLGVNHQPLSLLRNVSDARHPNQNMPLEFHEMAGFDECCGFGGVFSVEHAELSSAMVERKLNNIEQSGASTVVCCDAGCLANIYGAIKFRNRKHNKKDQIKVMHLAEILAFDPEKT